MNNKNEEINNELKHYGVLGMRWGIRNSRRDGGQGTAYEKKIASKKSTSTNNKQTRKERKAAKAEANQKIKEAKITPKILRKQIKNLSDTDLKAFKDRLELERQVKNLADDSIAPGRTFAKNLSTNTAKTTITFAAGIAAKYGTAKLISYLANKNQPDTRTKEEKAKDSVEFWNELSKIMVNNLKKK